MALFKRYSVDSKSEEGEKRVEELENAVEKVMQEMAYYKKKLEKLEATNNAHLQNISKLQSSLQQNTKHIETVELEQKTWNRERERLENRIAQLEDSLCFQMIKWEQERDKVIQDMTEKIYAHQREPNGFKSSLNYFKDLEVIVEEARDKTFQSEKRLQKTEKKVAELTSILKQQELETQNMKHKLEERNSSRLQIIRQLKDNLKHIEEEMMVAEKRRNEVMRDRDKLDKRLLNLEATLAEKTLN
ncbi:hypothetical protein C0J50_1677 [Silurus asotus]|uniref:Uncharacterized protein n=1 Tax=Silurus asotus TaxID=30991 RepID=A0AAD5A2B6_SILAS|nr:hypothetical protein C0J50_1677 [Silurus asotus]